ncbi:aldolase/citrate lyase family protein [Bradyrhizobium vignae]|uniref:aldolase/citrate lyase family protein n=1 Tax=Bradyrhizobium vignae TaxID=1549949 RepID=UPI00100A6207|nr:HpcH/HpaI aldolase/citrate lyase family protein [Bradyrhizobium vignae]RXG97235.1 4-hydroxy-2-oxo-heptane-1,7-dioate aldolase [Bradyrhizobium vignae]
MSNDLPRNNFKAALAKGEPQIGLWCCLADTVAAEISAGAGFDWLLLDCEHSPNDNRTILTQLQAVQAYPITAMVRPPTGNAVTIKLLLDIGAQNLLIPMVDTAEQAKLLVAATRFPPDGVRGVATQTRATRWGRVQHYLKSAREEIGLFLQVETKEALSNIEEIACVDGVDGIFIGPSDLAATLGHLGEPTRPEVQRMIEEALRSVRAAGKPAGILTPDETLARRYLELGATFVAVGIDTMLLARASSALLERFRVSKKP